ncbi:hypothetical protein WJX72_003786 [[Myrmecia] bisecta]|uniref:Septin-type G domain-containing protein n=1 Tax=[Myrmecia] bisecta TaxID=41462 RepID=A0AAW1PL33_9CHLO
MESPEPPTGTELSPAQQAVGKQATVQLGTTTETKESKSTASGLYDYLQKAFSPGQGPSGGETPQGSHSPNPEMPQLEEGRGDATLQTGDQGDTDACLTPRSLAGSDTPAGCRSPKPALPEAEVQLLRVNFMLCGRAGLGKTTCLRNMFEDYLEGVGGTPDAPLGDDVLAASSEGLGDRLVRMLVSTPPVPLDNDRRQIVYRIQDTPGYSEALPFAGQPEIAAAVDEMVAHVRSLKVKEWQEWNGAVAPRGLVEYQTMLDACLYFLPPHRLSTCDLQFLQKLSKEVPVILVIAKADSMTTAETLQYKREIMEIVKQPNTSALASAAGNGQPPQPIPIFSFDAEAANLGGVHFGPMPPFAIVCSPTVGPRGPERAFGWGTCYCWEPEHSDLVHLREMLLGSSGFRSLRAAKHECYSEYVEERSAADQASQQARTLAENAGQKKQQQK